MNIGAGKAAVYGLCGGTIAGAVIKPKTQSGEHAANKFSTVAGLGTLAVTPYLVKQAAKANPKAAEKIAHATGNAIEKGAEYAVKYGKKAGEYIKKAAASENGKKVVSFAEKVVNKFKNSKICSKIIKKVGEIANKVASNATVQKTIAKVTEGLKTFAKSSTTKKGLIGLAASGVALLAYAGIKTITNYYKKEGAIDQKYKDMEVMDKMLA